MSNSEPNTPLLYTYFASDFHLGLPLFDPMERERRVVRFLESIRHTAHTIYLLGDIFDFWWEYKTVVPRGFVRFLGKLAELTDAGVRIVIFTGNHDIWLGDYLQKECGVEIMSGSQLLTIGGKTFFIAHGDNLGNRSLGERIMKGIFYSSTAQRLYSAMHPRWGIGFGHWWSKHSRLAKGIVVPFKGVCENLYQFAAKRSAEEHVDYFVFGHRHTPIQMPLPSGAQLFILSDWIAGSTYAVYDNSVLTLREFQ